MTKKQLIRALAFALAAAVLLLVLCDLFKLSNNPNYDKYFYSYRHLPEDTIDAVFVGTSGMDRFWIGAKAYEEYGMSAWSLCVDAMPAWLYINVIEEALVYQKPELFILDIRAFTQDTDVDMMDVRGRRVLEAMDFFSANRFKTALDIMESIHEVDSSRDRWDASFVIPFIKFHTKWEDEGIKVIKDLGNRKHDYGSYYMQRELTVLVNPMDPRPYDADVKQELDPYSEKALYELLDYIRENDLNVVFVDTPQIRGSRELGRSNRIYEILEEEGMDYVHFYTEDTVHGFTVDLDTRHDFYNSGHVNYYGAEKFMDVFAAWLNENYPLPDRRGEKNAEKVWGGMYDRMKETIVKYEEYHATHPEKLKKYLCAEEIEE